MARQPKKLPAFFYQTAAGAERVRDWLQALDAEDRRIIGVDIATVEYGWPVGMPTAASRSQLDRLLDPENHAVSPETLTRAAHAVGRSLKLELV